MKKSILNKGVIWTLLVLLLAGLLAACSNPTGGDGKLATRATLQAAIARAEDAKDGVRIAIDGSTIPSNLSWVTAVEFAALEAAIEAAQMFVNRSSASQIEIELAVTTLNAAINNFIAAKKPGLAEEVDFSALKAKIDEAEELRDSVVVAWEADDVAEGTKWVTELEMNTFNLAIDAAKLVYNTALLASIVNAAVDPLDTAIATFNLALKDGARQVKATITITGMDNYNGMSVQLGVFDTPMDVETIDFEKPTDIWGYGNPIVKNGSVTVELYTGDHESTAPWEGDTGIWYTGFLLETVELVDEHYETRPIGAYQCMTPVSFSPNNKPTVSFSKFTQMVFSLSFDNFVKSMTGDDEKGYNEFLAYLEVESLTMGEFVTSVMTKIFDEEEPIAYEDLIDDMGFGLFQDKAMKNPFKADTVIKGASTMIYAPFPFWLNMDNEGDGEGEGGD